MTKRKRRRRSFSPEQKAAIIQRHLVGKEPVSALCEEFEIQPSVFYTWQKQLLENLPAAVEFVSGGKRSSRESALEKRIAELEAKLAKKDNVIAEISEEYVALKKELGEL